MYFLCPVVWYIRTKVQYVRSTVPMFWFRILHYLWPVSSRKVLPSVTPKGTNRIWTMTVGIEGTERRPCRRLFRFSSGQKWDGCTT